MNTAEIVKNHIKNNKISGDDVGLLSAIQDAVKNGFEVTKFNDVLFVHKDDGENCLFSIINGGGAKQYLIAIKKFIQYIKNKGITTILMYVSDVESSRKIAEAVGLKDIGFEQTDGNSVDNILLTART
jgi:hypothetical protein